MKATSRLAPSASSPPSVDDPSASTAPFTTLSPSFTIGFWWISVPWFERMNFVSVYSSRVPLPSTTIVPGVDVDHGAVGAGQDDVARVDRGAVLDAGADERRLRDHQRHCLPLHVRAHQRAVGVVVLEERDQRRRDRDDLRRRHVHVLDVLRRRPSTASPSRERHSTWSWTNLPVFSSTGSEAWAIVNCASSDASR